MDVVTVPWLLWMLEAKAAPGVRRRGAPHRVELVPEGVACHLRPRRNHLASQELPLSWRHEDGEMAQLRTRQQDGRSKASPSPSAHPCVCLRALRELSVGFVISVQLSLVLLASAVLLGSAAAAHAQPSSAVRRWHACSQPTTRA